MSLFTKVPHVGKYSTTVYFIVSTVWRHNYVYVINCNLCFHLYLLEYRQFFFIFHGFIHSLGDHALFAGLNSGTGLLRRADYLAPSPVGLIKIEESL